jgi:hypothetical protein
MGYAKKREKKKKSLPKSMNKLMLKSMKKKREERKITKDRKSKRRRVMIKGLQKKYLELGKISKFHTLAQS